MATDEERSAAESVIGSLGWLPRQLRMDVSFGYSWLAQQKNQATVQHLLEMNKLVRYCKETREVCLCFRCDILHNDEDLRSVVFADSSRNNVDDNDLGPIGEKVKSQLGLVCLLSDDGLYKHHEGPVRFLGWGGHVSRVFAEPRWERKPTDLVNELKRWSGSGR
eukprot:8765889-Pyramimonas_sp.AAC.1